MRVAHCRSCGAPIIWTVTTSGKKMPCDADPTDDGKFELVDDGGTPTAEYIMDDDYSGERYDSHFASCKDADTHRRSQR